MTTRLGRLTKVWWCVAITAVMFLGVSIPTRAQQPVGSLSGVVTDSKAGTISGATVTAVSKSTGASRAVPTNEAGFFLIATLLPGDYKLTIEMAGFATYIADRVVVEVGKTTRREARFVRRSQSYRRVRACMPARPP